MRLRNLLVSLSLGEPPEALRLGARESPSSKEHDRGSDHLTDIIDFFQIVHRPFNGIGTVLKGTGAGGDIVDIAVFTQPGTHQKSLAAPGRAIEDNPLFLADAIVQAVVGHLGIQVLDAPHVFLPAHVAIHLVDHFL
jgi:hypothetical protein